jgi:hypothetical protein
MASLTKTISFLSSFTNELWRPIGLSDSETVSNSSTRISFSPINWAAIQQAPPCPLMAVDTPVNIRRPWYVVTLLPYFVKLCLPLHPQAVAEESVSELIENIWTVMRMERWSNIQRVNLLIALKAQGSAKTIRRKMEPSRLASKHPVFFKPCSA